MTWEYRTVGVWGIHSGVLFTIGPLCHPAGRLSRPVLEGGEMSSARAVAEEHKKHSCLTGWGGELLERFRALRRYEDVLMDLALDTPEINMRRVSPQQVRDYVVRLVEPFRCDEGWILAQY